MSFVKVNTEDPAFKEIAKEHVKVLPTFKFFKARLPPLPCTRHNLRVGRQGCN